VPLAHPSAVSTPEHFDDANANALAEDDDFDDAWGDMGDDDHSAPVDSSERESSAAAAKPSLNPFDDGGEPDFAGWLAAQAQSKSNKPLPKGLAKPAGKVAAASKPSTTSASKVGAAAKPKPSAKKVDTKPKEEGWGDDDGWGDGWD
jgi:SCY1-like protein 1